MTQSSPNYIFDASEKPSLAQFDVPLIVATKDSVKAYGCLVNNPDTFDIEIVRWPAQGWRPIDEGTGDEGGFVEGVFHGNWKGDVLYGSNEAVNGNYVLGWSTDPQKASVEAATCPREKVLLWHMNYHPDGGQMFFPLEQKPFVVPVALPGDDLASGAMDRRGCISILAFGTRGFFRLRTTRDFWTGKVASTRVSAVT